MMKPGYIGVGRRLATLLTVLMGALVLASGVAYAASITCQVGVDCLGTKNADILEGTGAADIIFGRAGNDTLRANGTSDYLDGQGGSDRLLGGPANDHLFGGPGNDILRGGADTDGDMYYFVTNNWGKDSISDSTPSSTMLNFTADEGTVTEALTISLIAGAGPEVKNASGTSTINWESDTLIHTVISGDGNDNITGDFLNNMIYAGQGTDTISTLAGNDTIDVIDGEVDTVNCGSGLFGSPDHDYVYYDSFDVVNDNCEVKSPATL